MAVEAKSAVIDELLRLFDAKINVFNRYSRAAEGSVFLLKKLQVEVLFIDQKI